MNAENAGTVPDNLNFSFLPGETEHSLTTPISVIMQRRAIFLSAIPSSQKELLHEGSLM
jgi:hypothetical protein